MKRFFFSSIITGFAALALVACGNTHGHSGDGHMHKGLEISNATVIPPFPGRDIAAGYFSITNHTGMDDAIIAAALPLSDTVEIHTHLNEDGVMKMRRINSVPIKAGETVHFQPGGFHLMIFDVEGVTLGDEIPLTLTYQNADPVTVMAIVSEDAPDIGHSDHSGH